MAKPLAVKYAGMLYLAASDESKTAGNSNQAVACAFECTFAKIAWRIFQTIYAPIVSSI